MEKLPHQKTIEKQPYESKEIDLALIFSKIYRSFLNLVKSILRFAFLFFDSIFNNIRLILSFLVVGGVLGLGYYYVIKPYYTSSMTLNSDYYKGELLDNSINNLNELCKQGNSQVLANLLNIRLEKAKQIRSIEVNPLVSQNFRMLVDLYKSDEKYRQKLDSLLLYNNQSTFQLNVEVYDTAALKGLDTVLVNYIKDNDFVSKRIEVDRSNLMGLRDKLNRESSKLDTLKRSIASSIKSSGDAGRSGTNNVILGEKNVNPIEIYREDLQIYNQRQSIERQLALNAEVEIIEKFIPFSKPKSGSLFINMVKGAIGGLILGLLYVLYYMLRESLTRLRYSLEEKF